MGTGVNFQIRQGMWGEFNVHGTCGNQCLTDSEPIDWVGVERLSFVGLMGWG